MYLSNAQRFRRTVAGICMVAGPLLLLIGAVIHPDASNDEGAQLAIIAADADAWYTAHLLVLVAIALAVPAVLGLMHMLRERQVALGHVGGGLALLGLLAFVGIVAIEGFVGWQMATAGDRGEMTALLERLYDTAGVTIPFFVVSLGFVVGMVCLAIGLYRARAVQSWMAVCLAVGAVCLQVAAIAAVEWLTLVGAAFLLVGLGSIGRMVLRETDEAWEHTPEYEGFRPLLGAR